MPSFSFSGGVEVLGFISPTDTNDNYPVIDPLYGIDGLRNVNNLIELNSIPNPRRRAGMVVGVNSGNIYYKLNPSPWNGTITDWSVFQSGSGGTFSGGTVSGNTYFTNNLSATTFSATTYLGLPTDVFVTGGTYSNGTTIFTNNTGGTFNVVGFYTGESSYVNTIITSTGISANTNNGNVTLINTLPDQIVNLNQGTNINISGLYPNFNISVTGLTDNNTEITAFTYNNNTFTIFDNSGSTFSSTFDTVTGLTITGNLDISGDTNTIGTITSSSLIGIGDRIVQTNSGGTLTATTQIISGYLISGSTQANLLSDINNWDINGNYTGSTITGTFQGQRYYDSNYFFEAVDDNLFIRLIRG